jgi:ABC-2 type transport system permease protein
MHQPHPSHSQDVLRAVLEQFPGLVSRATIPFSVQAKDSAAARQPIFSYDPTSTVADAYRLLGEELDRFENYIVRGDFDSVLIRPWPSLFVLLSRNLDLTRVTWVIQGAAVGWISAGPLLARGTLTWAGVLQLVLASIWTACMYMAVGIATSSAAFKIVRIEELQVFTQNAPGTAVLYPLEIYPGWLRFVLLTVIPLGVGNYIPVRYILGKGGTWWNLALPPIVAVLSLYVSVLLWHAGEARYHSTGS